MAIGNLSINDKSDINRIDSKISEITDPNYYLNLYNRGLNSTNIDEWITQNYVVGISNDGYGTTPSDGWWNILQFFCYHFLTQIATEVFSSGGGLLEYI